jgi:DALR anticodon binding domain
VIPADLGADLAAAIEDLVAAGRLPPSAAGLSAVGTWRPAPAGPTPALGSQVPASPAAGAAAGSAAARYATSLPFELARLTGEEPRAIAAELGRVIVWADWVASAEPTGAGYLTIGVTAAALAAVAVRISQAGPSCVRSGALQAVSRPAPPLPDLAAPLSWRQAWRDQAAALTGRLALAAGATALPPEDPKPAGDSPSGRAAVESWLAGPSGAALTRGGDPGRPPAGSSSAGRSTVAEAVAYAGADAVRYWLARMPAARAGVLDQAASAGRDPARPHEPPPREPPREPPPHEPPREPPSSAPPHEPPSSAAPPYPAPPAAPPSRSVPSSAVPLYLRDLAAVRFAAADAAATGRWAAELGLARLEPLEAGQLGQPAEIALLSQLSWLPERVAGAARHRQPDELPRYLERLASAWLDCREDCPALPFGGRAAPGGAAGISARLWLAEATATALAAGLDLVGVRP